MLGAVSGKVGHCFLHDDLEHGCSGLKVIPGRVGLEHFNYCRTHTPRTGREQGVIRLVDRFFEPRHCFATYISDSVNKLTPVVTYNNTLNTVRNFQCNFATYTDTLLLLMIVSNNQIKLKPHTHSHAPDNLSKNATGTTVQKCTLSTDIRYWCV